jgi:hypothetical protein
MTLLHVAASAHTFDLSGGTDDDQDGDDDDGGDSCAETSPGYDSRAEAVGPNLSGSFIASEDEVNDLSSTDGNEDEDEDAAGSTGPMNEGDWCDEMFTKYATQ